MNSKHTEIRRQHLLFVIQVWQERARKRGGQWVIWAAQKIEEAKRMLKVLES